MIFCQCGPSASKDGSVLQRLMRDAMTYRTHVQAQNRTTAHELARVRWGLRTPSLGDAG
jgi:hypothetical protein